MCCMLMGANKQTKNIELLKDSFILLGPTGTKRREEKRAGDG